MVFVSMMWTVTMDTRGLLAVLILIIYCITMRKTISVTSMMITGFFAPPVKRRLSFVFWGGGFRWFVYLRIFHVIFLEPLFVNAQLVTSLFLVLRYANSSSFFAIIQLFSKLSSKNSTKMFIKILKSISSYVYCCSLSLFIAALKFYRLVCRRLNASFTSSSCLSFFLIHLNQKSILSANLAFFHPVSPSIFALVCNLSPLIKPP